MKETKLCSVLLGRPIETHGMMKSSTSLMECCLHRGICLFIRTQAIIYLCTFHCILILYHEVKSAKRKKQLTGCFKFSQL
jgi:hypothetical protein